MHGLFDGTDNCSQVAPRWARLMSLLLASLLCAFRIAAHMPSPHDALKGADMSIVESEGSVQCNRTSDKGPQLSLKACNVVSKDEQACTREQRPQLWYCACHRAIDPLHHASTDVTPTRCAAAHHVRASTAVLPCILRYGSPRQPSPQPLVRVQLPSHRRGGHLSRGGVSPLARLGRTRVCS